MPPKKKVNLPDHVREAVLDDVQLSRRVSEESDATYKIRIYLATEQGLTTYEIADSLRLAQQSVSRYARQGQELYEARKEALRNEQAGDGRGGGDPDRPRELVQNGG